MKNVVNLDKLYLDFKERDDDDSFSKLFLNLQKIVFSKLRNYSIDYEEINDVIQNAWIKVLKNLDGFDSEKGSFLNYFFTIIKNDTLKHIKKEERKESLSGDNLEDEVYNLEMNETDISFKIMGIPEIFRDPLILYFYYDVELKEISRMLGIPENTVKSRLSRGKKALRSSLT